MFVADAKIDSATVTLLPSCVPHVDLEHTEITQAQKGSFILDFQVSFLAQALRHFLRTLPYMPQNALSREKIYKVNTQCM